MKYLLIAILSFPVNAVKEDHIMLGICTVMILQDAHDAENEALKGRSFLVHYWIDVAEGYDLTIRQLFSQCKEMLMSHHRRAKKKEERTT